jgi:hypothetical protein
MFERLISVFPALFSRFYFVKSDKIGITVLDR